MAIYKKSLNAAPLKYVHHFYPDSWSWFQMSYDVELHPWKMDTSIIRNAGTHTALYCPMQHVKTYIWPGLVRQPFFLRVLMRKRKIGTELFCTPSRMRVSISMPLAGHLSGIKSTPQVHTSMSYPVLCLTSTLGDIYRGTLRMHLSYNNILQWKCMFLRCGCLDEQDTSAWS